MSYWKLYYHFIWTTRRREPLILPSFEADLYAVIARKIKGIGATLYAIGGMEEHVHIVVSVPPKLSLAAFIGEIKGYSSHFVNHVVVPDYKFYWQYEYGVFSFREKELPAIVRYVKNQKKHHATNTLNDLLEKI